jgi:hypothetical protein
VLSVESSCFKGTPLLQQCSINRYTGWVTGAWAWLKRDHVILFHTSGSQQVVLQRCRTEPDHNFRLISLVERRRLSICSWCQYIVMMIWCCLRRISSPSRVFELMFNGLCLPQVNDQREPGCQGRLFPAEVVDLVQQAGLLRVSHIGWDFAQRVVEFL